MGRTDRDANERRRRGGSIGFEVNPKPLWDLTPAKNSLKVMLRDFVASIPLIGVALAVIALFYALAKFARDDDATNL